MENEEKQELTALEMIQKLEGTEEFNTLIKNKSKEYIGAELKTVYGSFDSVIKETLGLEKPDNVKSTEWAKQNLSKLAEAKRELKALQEKGDGGKEIEKLYEDKVSKLNQLLQEKDEQLKKVSQKSFESVVSNQVDNYLVGKTFNPTYSESVVNTLVKANKAEIVNNTKTLDNGKVAVWNAEKGQYYTDTLGEPLSPSQVAEKLFAPMFQTSKQGGNAPSEESKAVIQGDVIAINMNEIKSKAAFYQAFKNIMAPKGLTSLDEKYQIIQRATMEHYKITELPLS